MSRSKTKTLKKIYITNDSKEKVIENNRTIVIGAGIIGAACAAALARKGENVTLIDGSCSQSIRSSYGDTRGIQFGYNGIKGKLITRAEKLWNKLEKESPIHKKLLYDSGNLYFGNLNDIEQLMSMYNETNRYVEKLKGNNIESIFPQIKAHSISKNMTALYDSTAKAVDAQAAINSFINIAKENGAIYIQEENVIEIDRKKQIVITAKKDHLNIQN